RPLEPGRHGRLGSDVRARLDSTPQCRPTKRGMLKLEVPLRGTHATLLLHWQRRYPHADGWIEPWTTSGRLRSGLWLVSTQSGGACGRGSYETVAKAALRCSSPAESAQFDPASRNTPTGGIAGPSSPVRPIQEAPALAGS